MLPDALSTILLPRIHLVTHFKLQNQYTLRAYRNDRYFRQTLTFFSFLLYIFYLQTLRLSKSALDRTAAGQVVNLLSNDVNRFDTLPLYLNYVWIMPFQVCRGRNLLVKLYLPIH